MPAAGCDMSRKSGIEIADITGDKNKGEDVRRILITGMSAVGKSSVVEELCWRGHKAIDLDSPEWSEYGHADQESDLDWVGMAPAWKAGLCPLSYTRISTVLQAPRAKRRPSRVS